MRASGTDALQAAPYPGRTSAIELDQYYTREDIAKRLLGVLQALLGANECLFVEPSAGNGSFFKILPAGSFGCDREPKCPDIMVADFLTLEILSNLRICVIGNPPFGERAGMAIQFFNHAAEFASFIAFIVPRSFRADTIRRRLHPAFHLVHDEDVEDNAFIFEGRPVNVPTAFQIWERRPEARELPRLEYSHPDFKIASAEKPHFAIQRICAQAGRVHHDFERSSESHYFIRVNPGLCPAYVEIVMSMLDLRKAARDSGIYPSLTIPRLIALYREFIDADAQRCSD